MNATRFAVFATATLVVAGMGVGTAAYLGSAGVKAQADRLPEAVQWMPADSEFVAHVNVGALLKSPLRDQWEAHQTEKSFEELEEFRRATGIDPLTDIDSFAVSTSFANGKPGAWSMAAKGNFNPDALISSIEQQLSKEKAHAKLEKLTYHNARLYLFTPTPSDRKDPGPQALAFPDARTALFGSPDRVKRMLDSGARSALLTAGTLGRWVEEMSDQDTLWLAGNGESALQRMLLSPRDGRREGASAAPQIPPLKLFAFSARLGQTIEATARGEAADPEAARKLGDVVRGFVALGSLQAQQTPEVGALLDSIQIQTVENRVEVSMSLPYETLEKLAPSRPKAEAQR